MSQKNHSDTLIKEDWKEEEILHQSQSDAQAFKPLYERYYKKLFLFILHRTGEKERAADLCQQVFLKVLTNINKYQFRGLPFSSWLYRIAINECNDYFRKSKKTRYVTLDNINIDQLYEEITADHSQEELQKKLPDILEKLTEDELQIIELRFFECRPFKEIGDILNVTENNAKVKTYRALDRMKALF
jgi:RNA polymerase sigma-70 factor (ECF subfamily)